MSIPDLRESEHELGTLRRRSIPSTGRASKDCPAYSLGSSSSGSSFRGATASGLSCRSAADVTAWEIAGTYAFLGTATPQPYVLNWVKQQYVQLNPPPADETAWDVRLPVPLSPSVIEGLEERRQGKDFSIQIDTTILLVDGGMPGEPRTETYYGTHPTRTAQDTIRISQNDWGQVLERWERGLGIPVVLPLIAMEPSRRESGGRTPPQGSPAEDRWRRLRRIVRKL